MILTNRLLNLGLVHKKFTSVSDAVKYFGAIQAQDYNAVKWALGLRIPNMDESQIEKAIEDENLIRTHVLRPTWHLVHKNDIRWLLDLTADRVKQVMASQLKKLNISENDLKSSFKVIEESLVEDVELTGNELGKKIVESNPDVKKSQIQLILLYAELDQLICNGNNQEKHTNYTLFECKVPKGKVMEQEKAIEELETRYFTSHGPATAQDFARWSGLTISDTKNAIQTLKERGKNELLEEEGLFYFNELIEANLDHCNYLLPRFDEYFNGYKEKRLFLKEYNVSWEPLGKNVLIYKGQIIGNWKRKLTKNEVMIDYKFLFETNNFIKNSLENSTRDYAGFLNKKLKIL